MAKGKKKNEEQWSSSKTGKEFELFFLHKLYECMRENRVKCDVFQPLVDDNGIDYVIRLPKGTYVELQIKAREEKRLFTIDNTFTERPNYWFVFYCKNQQGGYDCYRLKSKKVKNILTKHKNHLRIKEELEKDKVHDFKCFLEA